MHGVGDIKQTCTTTRTKFITLSVLLCTAVPAALVSLMVGHLVDVFLLTCAHHLGDFVAPRDGRAALV